MLSDEQLEWIDSQRRRDPCWSETEFSIRQAAMQAMIRDDAVVYLSLPVYDWNAAFRGLPSPFKEVRIYMPRGIYGSERILLAEKLIREAMNDSR